MDSNKRAFTLIELLVVVLIIGILAAVALPQYQLAVMKSRLAPIMSNVKSFVNASEVYYLAHGEYPDDNDITGIDLGMENCAFNDNTTKRGTFFCQNAEYDFGYTNNDQLVIGFLKSKPITLVSGNKADYLGIAYAQYPQNALPVNKRGTRECFADETNSIANKACLSLNGSKYDSLTWRNITWNKYRLP